MAPLSLTTVPLLLRPIDRVTSDVLVVVEVVVVVVVVVAGAVVVVVAGDVVVVVVVEPANVAPTVRC